MVVVPNAWPESVATLVAAAADGRAGAIREALAAIRALPVPEQGRSFTLGICRTFTVETQLSALTLGLATLPCRPEITVADLENIEQVVLDPSSAIFGSDAILVLWRLEELHPRLVFEYDGMTAAERVRAVADVIARVTRLCREYARVGTAPLFLSTLPDALPTRAATHDVYAVNGPRHAIVRINQALIEAAAEHAKINLFDFAGWAARGGSEAFDLKLDLYARQPIAARSAMSFAGAVADTLRPLVHAPAKVLALDLDNVLWGGIVGEDGVSGLKIGHDFPGNVYRRIQQYALALKRRGVLLVLLSKNNEADVEQAFAELPPMPLTLADFAARRINWQPKSENIADVARELNLGLDSFVFVDDQPFEREQMRFARPEVRVLGASEDPLHTLRSLNECRWFDMHRVSDADRRRSDDYAAQAQRRALSADVAEDGPGFLEALDLKADIAPVSEATLPRAAQMLGKTNQFNVTTRRHTEAELRRMLASADNVLLTLSLSDRFGDQGIVGLAIGIGDRASGTMTIDSFLFSCRAIGRGAEDALWASIVSRARSLGFSSLRAEYVRTAKNGQVADLFDRFGMTRQPHSTADHGTYALDVPEAVPFPAWIAVNDATGVAAV